MTRNTAILRKVFKRKQQARENNNELGSITLQYNGKHYVVELPNNADASLIRQIIKGKTGVEGAFYMHFGDQLTNYLHRSSITSENLAKLAGGYGKFWKKINPVCEEFNSQFCMNCLETEYRSKVVKEVIDWP